MNYERGLLSNTNTLNSSSSITDSSSRKAAINGRERAIQVSILKLMQIGADRFDTTYGKPSAIAGKQSKPTFVLKIKVESFILIVVIFNMFKILNKVFQKPLLQQGLCGYGFFGPPSAWL